MRGFYGAHRRRAYFEGWYCKQQNEGETLALIPAFHIDGQGVRTASLQVVTDERSFCAQFPIEQFRAQRDRFCVRLGDSLFSRQGCRLCVHTDEWEMTGELAYGRFCPPAYDIMGPFARLPGMQCRHSVYSFAHRVEGEVTLCGRRYSFDHGLGYMEGDRGSGFPERYLWTQCGRMGDAPTCVMLALATVPFCGLRFTGCIGAVCLDGREYRLATYLGARMVRMDARGAAVRQGALELEAELLEGSPCTLRAPVEGSMRRSVHESAACRVRYRFARKGRALLELESDRASFEWAEQ